LPDGRAWVGILVQNPGDNWAGPGSCGANGARLFTVKARGEVGGEAVTFSALGVDVPATLTTAWQDYSINISTVDYNNYNPAGGVNGGFAVFMTDPDLQRVVYVDDIQWE
jgi:hypothetical protein